jgi:hypothetical protein
MGKANGTNWLGFPGQNAPDANLPAGSRGFLVMLSVTTPHKDGYQYINDALVGNLKKFDRAAMDKYNLANHANPKNFYIGRVFPPTGQMQLRNDAAWNTAATASYTAYLTVTGNTAAPGAAVAAANDPKAHLDRLTGESRDEDWEMKVGFVMVIDPPKAAPAPTTP